MRVRRGPPTPRLVRSTVVTALLLAACAADDSGNAQVAGRGGDMVERAVVHAAIDSALKRAAAVNDSVDALFRPVPLLTPAQEAVFNRFNNAAQLQRARALGVRAGSAAEHEAAVRAGRLVRLEDSTEYWIVRKLTHSEPYVTPDARALLLEIGRRFHARLDAMGVPRYRMEVTSLLRTAASQAELRRVNPNAALGESTHEYGTTIDVAYASYGAPAYLGFDVGSAGTEWLTPQLQRIAGALLETVAARNALELRAILGLVMIDVQNDGLAMVTLERLQPVYHFTLARRMDARGS
jgi:hypothetical protein